MAVEEVILFLSQTRTCGHFIIFKFKKHFKAENGGDGGKSRSSGSNGMDQVIKVPVGTVVKDSETNEIIFESIDDGDKKIVVQGGKRWPWQLEL